MFRMVLGYRITTKWVWAVGISVEGEIREKIDDEIPPIVFIAMPPKKQQKDKDKASKHTGRKPGAKGWGTDELKDALMTTGRSCWTCCMG